jgi:hypothetical protein
VYIYNIYTHTYYIFKFITMRFDDDVLYRLPALTPSMYPYPTHHHDRTIFSNTPTTIDENEEKKELDEEDHAITMAHHQSFYPYHHKDAIAAATDDDDKNNHDDQLYHPCISLELVPLPLLTDELEQTPIGAQGWYASAVLAAMLLCGHETLHRDLLGPLQTTTTTTTKTTTSTSVMELGSGTLGLGGMTMAWILAQYRYHQHTYTTSHDQHHPNPSQMVQCKVVMTDYDPDCLAQLENNAGSVRQTLKEYFPHDASECIPDIVVEHLDWNEYDQDQSLLMGNGNDSKDLSIVTTGNDDATYTINSINSKNTIHFVCGAALVYTEETAACADQVGKILLQNPQAVVWVVQWPRKGWFHVFQMQLERNYGCTVTKYVPTDIHPNIHTVAQTLMAPQSCLNIIDIRAIRITGKDKVEDM